MLSVFVFCFVVFFVYGKQSYLSVPVVDQCVDVNASEPYGCPNKIGPPCPPCFTNTRPDYNSNDDSNDLTFTNIEKDSIRSLMTWYMNWWSANYPPSTISHGYNLFAGSAGRANIFLRLFIHSSTATNGGNLTLLSIADQYIDHALLIMLAENQTYGSFLFGNIGVWSLKAVIEEFKNNSNIAQEYLQLIRYSFESIAKAMNSGANYSSNGISMDKCGLDQGLTGMLFNALLLNSYFKSDIIDVEIIHNLSFYILDWGMKTGSKLNTNYLQYECPFLEDCYLWGPGHGSSGVIYTLFTAYKQYPTLLAKIFSSPYLQVIQNTMDFYVSIQLEDGNIPTDVSGTCASVYGTDDDARVQWCHGCPGFQSIFVLSANYLAKYNSTAAEMYLNAGLRCANATWNRGLLVKGTMFCHGIAGNSNMLWEFGHLLRELKNSGQTAFLDKLSEDGYDLQMLMNQSVWRAKQFILWTLDWNNINRTRIYDSNEPYSMYQGNFAIPMLYVQTLQSGWPWEEGVCHPGWNLCI